MEESTPPKQAAPRPTDAAGLFARAQQCVGEGRSLEALAALEQAHAAAPTHPRYASHLGLLLARQRGLHRRALQLCQDAVAADPAHAVELHINLVEVHLCAQDRNAAVMALARALSDFPDHPQLLALRKRVGVRRNPAFAFLDRSHPANKYLGLFTWHLGLRG
jgi:tetratricopeptide (TPR) repeat protein